MALYLVKRHESDYDEYDAHLIRASSEREARKIAAAKNHREDSDEWLNVLKSSCVLISPGGLNEVILSSFNAG